MKAKLIVVLMLSLVLSVPHLAMAAGAGVHYFDCKECHLSGLNLLSLQTGNVCLKCHDTNAGNTTTLNPGNPQGHVVAVKSDGQFSEGDASDQYGFGAGAGQEVSHNWAAPSVNAAAGATEPVRALHPTMFGMRGRNAGKVNCARCHDPHAAYDIVANPDALVANEEANDLCVACHSDFSGGFSLPGNFGYLTHPLLNSAQLAAVQADGEKAPKFIDMAGTLPLYNEATPYANNVQLVDGGVGCISCHGLHFADSNSSTTDGPLGTYGSGDGLLLRSDGPTRTGATQNDDAQLRSNLCQSCHAYKMHGNTSSSYNIGCLDCHGGHSRNGGTPSSYVLSDQSPDAVPTRLHKVYNGDVQVSYPVVLDSTSTRLTWADNIDGGGVPGVGEGGFCEKCHGDVNEAGAGGLANSVDQHKTSGGDECSNCHKHSDADFSFKLDASAASCGDCHGFPPFKNIRGDRAAWYDARDGGYAFYNSAGYDYLNDSGHFKDESTTAHKSHAGRDLKTGPNTAVLGADGWYFVGATGIDNCKPCHGTDASYTSGGHKVDPVSRPETFRDVPFDAIATGQGNLVTTYNDATARCNNVYCHTAGAPRDGDSSRFWSYGAAAPNTPAWDVASGGGYNSILGTGSARCQTCHGNDINSMSTKGNTAAHAVHINSATLNYACGVCHENTAIDMDNLSANATDHRAASGGLHVNGVQDVVFNSTVLGGKLAVDKNNYNSATGTCSVYCHDPANTGLSADWDITGALTCNSCHADQVTTFSGSHERHVPNAGSGATGPQLTCAECHDTGSDTGTHAGHVDGVVTYITLSGADETKWGSVYPQNFCDKCHGYDAQQGEVQPSWGVQATGKDCATCHAGYECGDVFNGNNGAPDFPAARKGGHNRSASGYNAVVLYPESDNAPAAADCDNCHITDSANHWNGVRYTTSGDELDLMLRNGLDGFPAAPYQGNENNYCNNCHGTSPAHPTHSASPATQGIETHIGKLCVACHNVHGDAFNVQMIWSDYVQQNLHDSGGMYNGVTVSFTNLTDFGTDSYDEDDGLDGTATEDNSDDLCATCHTAAGGDASETTLHNNRNNTGSHSGGDNLGTNCLAVCHAPHTASGGGAFKVAAGTSCTGCHQYPPATGAHLLHSVSTNPDGSDDRSDCVTCHGSDVLSYTYTTGEFNHSDATNRRNVLANTVGFDNNGTVGIANNGDDTCTSACHNTSLTEAWGDTAGLACNSCHYYSASPSAAGNVQNGRSEAISTSHNEHFEAGKTCGDCHDILGAEYNNGSSIAGPLAHINDKSGADDAAVYNGAALALQDEAGFDEGGGVRDVLAALNYTDANTCSGATTGCHATGTPDWDLAIPPTSAGCQQCHTDTTNTSFNPTSGLHNNTATLTVTNNAHDGSFYNGSTLAVPADCVTCHTTSPSSGHMDGSRLGSQATINAAIISTYNATNLTCNTSCHSAGTMWAYKWSNTAYNSDGTQCANCHGRWGDWRTGVTHRMDATPQGTHGTGTLACKDCHALQASSGYTYTTGTGDWNENDPGTTGLTAETSNHGDGFITMNENTTQFGRNGGGLSGCAQCHSAYDGTSTGQFSFTTTTWTNAAVIGDVVPITCSSCHGGSEVAGPSANNFWPDGTNSQDDSAGAKNNSGAHSKHMLELAKAVYPLDIGADDAATIDNLLTDNTSNYASLTSEDKQKELCAYCHNNPGVNPGHNDDALPAETLATANDGNTSGQGFYELWEAPRVDRDSSDYDTTGSGSCYVSSCHNSRATDANATNYGWYANNSSSCETCHDPNNVVLSGNVGGVTHIAHKNSATLFGRGAVCAECHDSATDWAGNTVPGDGFHIDGTFAVQSGSVVDGSTVIYNATNGCGANACHNDGTGAVPVDNTYAWTGGALSDCTICHLDPPGTGAHAEHMGSTTYVDCIDCHTPATDTGNHIRGSVTYNTTTITEYPAAGGAGSCTNTCHIAGDGGDWTGGFTALACADCHSGSYVGGGGNMPTSGLHVTYNITTHDASLQTGNCINCHDANGPTSAADHGNGTLEGAATVPYSFNANVVSYNSTTGCMANASCHPGGDGGTWRRKWSGVVDQIPTAANVAGDPVCDNCHGAPALPGGFDTPSAWRWDEANGTTTDHTDPYGSNPGGSSVSSHGSTGSECQTCHGWGDPAYNVATMHNDGLINMNGPDSTPGPAGGTQYNSSTGGCDAAGCHGPTYVFNTNSGWTESYLAMSAGGACDSCHGNGSGNYWPDGSGAHPDDDAGLHGPHMNAMILKGIGQQTACGYCHVDPYGANHNDATVDMANVAPYTSWKYKRIIGGGDDSNGIFNTSAGPGQYTCSNIDCHFNNSYTPHWYGPGTIQPSYGDTNVKPDPVKPGTSLTLHNTVTADGNIKNDANPNGFVVEFVSPGMDQNLENTTAYVYDMRISESNITNNTQFNSATFVGGLPSTYVYNSVTYVNIEHLDHNKSYYVALRTQDTEGLWSDLISAGPVTPRLDDEPPMFYGADRATVGDEGSTLNLWWTAAEDHSMFDVLTLDQTPIKYNIYVKSTADGILDMNDGTGYNSPILNSATLPGFDILGFTGTAIELEGDLNHSDGGVTTSIASDVTYQLGVRACDQEAPPNCDINTAVVKVTPTGQKVVRRSFHDYVSSGSSTLNRDGTPGGSATTVGMTQGTPYDFSGATQAHPVNYFVDSFTVAFTNDRNPNEIQARVGLWSGGSCTPVGTASSVSPGSRATVVPSTFKFDGTLMIAAAANESFCIQVTVVSGGDDIQMVYGTSASRGDASVAEQIKNIVPSGVSSPTVSNLTNGLITMDWQTPADDGDGLSGIDGGDPLVDYDPIHYDIYGSDDNGATWKYVLAEEMDDATECSAGNCSFVWDTQASGITSGTLAVKIRPGDGFDHATTGITFLNKGTATAVDAVAPSQITDLQVLPRPKKGAVQLRWTCPGDDYMNNGRAEHYEIKYDTREIVASGGNGTTTVNFSDIPAGRTATSGTIPNPPYPDFGGHVMEFEVTGLIEDTDYYFAIVTEDEQHNAAPISTVKGGSTSALGTAGPKCGMCHDTGPSVVESAGNHKLHGYTLYDCDKCHDAGGGDNPSNFGLDHQDGLLKMGYGTTAVVGTIVANSITYYDGPDKMYEDTDGFGGFGDPSDPFNLKGDGVDNGGCFNFGSRGVLGCHGPAGSDPDGNSGNSEYPLFETPLWDANANLDCGRCHGNPNRAETATGYIGGTYKKDPYGRDFDGTLANGGVVPDQIIGAPGVDNRGGWNSASLNVDETKYIGQHEKHLNYSFRFSKGDSCSLCHKGHYDERDQLDGKHGDGIVDVQLDIAAAGAGAHYNSAGAGVAGQCFSMDPYNCHPNNEAPSWDSNDTFPCLGCHTMQNDITKIGHYTDPFGGITLDQDNTNQLDGFANGLPGNCTWCHFAGHPTDDVGGTALILPNNPTVGVNYKSGGIHLRKQPGGPSGPHASYNTQAELCWGCHDAQPTTVSEWGPDNGQSNVNSAILPANGNIYNAGKLDQSNWIGAIWTSGQTLFSYKTGRIQSTHTTNLENGSSEVVYNATRGQYEENTTASADPDTVDEIMCHHCHDVHNMNFAPGDVTSDNPYLRGTWLSNPYPEDGAPQSGQNFTAATNFGPIPRGGSAYNQLGGFQIDQNNPHSSGPPTKGKSLGNSAGLCTLCHSNPVNDMDNVATSGENLWFGANGHSNAALGGTADDTKVADIFNYTDRNPSGDPVEYTGNYGPGLGGNPAMGYMNSYNPDGSEEFGGGFRSVRNGAIAAVNANLEISANFAYNTFNWGVTQANSAANIVNKGFHAFSCSKCHSPHASRLPKLLITNCLDTKHNTWDDNEQITAATTTSGPTTSADNRYRTLSNATSAQNCHRVGDPYQDTTNYIYGTNGDSPGTGAGWNKVSPWSVAVPPAAFP